MKEEEGVGEGFSCLYVRKERREDINDGGGIFVDLCAPWQGRFDVSIRGGIVDCVQLSAIVHLWKGVADSGISRWGFEFDQTVSTNDQQVERCDSSGTTTAISNLLFVSLGKDLMAEVERRTESDRDFRLHI